MTSKKEAMRGLRARARDAGLSRRAVAVLDKLAFLTAETRTTDLDRAALAALAVRHPNGIVLPGVAFPSQRYLAGKTGYCERSVRDAVRELEWGGYIVTRRVRSGTRYVVAVPPLPSTEDVAGEPARTAAAPATAAGEPARTAGSNRQELPVHSDSRVLLQREIPEGDSESETARSRARAAPHTESEKASRGPRRLVRDDSSERAAARWVDITGELQRMIAAFYRCDGRQTDVPRFHRMVARLPEPMQDRWRRALEEAVTEQNDLVRVGQRTGLDLGNDGERKQARELLEAERARGAA